MGIEQHGGFVPAQQSITVLGSSGTPVSVTGNTNETQLASIKVPANSMGPNGRLRITTLWSWTNSANNKVTRVRLGGAAGTVFGERTATTTASMQGLTQIVNNGAANAQKGRPIGSLFAPYGDSAGVILTSAIDTTVDTTVYISGQLANSGETITLEAYTVELIPGV